MHKNLMMIKNNSVLKIEKTISLPMAVETHAVLADWNEELWILINSIQNKETFIFKLNDSLTFEKIITLPLISTSATTFENTLTIVGANFEGKPMLLSINNLGEIQQEIILEITPTIWPVATFSNEIFIAWQENANEINLGNLDWKKNEIDNLKKISINNPPAKLFPLKDTIFATFSEKNKTHFINLINNEISDLDISQPITVGETRNSIFYAWIEDDVIYLKLLKKDKLQKFTIKKASLGNLKAISGNIPALWLQKQEMQIDEVYKWKSTIFQENTDLFEMDGFVYSVISWKKRIVAIQNSQLILLKT